jgi:hypothetical protein
MLKFVFYFMATADEELHFRQIYFGIVKDHWHTKNV